MGNIEKRSQEAEMMKDRQAEESIVGQAGAVNGGGCGEDGWGKEALSFMIGSFDNTGFDRFEAIEESDIVITYHNKQHPTLEREFR